jgi:hypothetical protein
MATPAEDEGTSSEEDAKEAWTELHVKPAGGRAVQPKKGLKAVDYELLVAKG